jgi:plasmid stabilization system protein ParE
MAFNLISSASAQLEVKDIAFFISEDSPSAARGFMQSLFMAAERLRLTTSNKKVECLLYLAGTMRPSNHSGHITEVS